MHYAFLQNKKELMQYISSILIEMEHATGIGPAHSAWEANVLPLNYACSA